MSSARRRSPRLDPLEGRRLPSTTLPLASSAKAAYHQAAAKPAADASPTAVPGAAYHQSAASPKGIASAAPAYHQSTAAVGKPAGVAGASNYRVRAAAATAQDVGTPQGAVRLNLKAGQLAGPAHQASTPAPASTGQTASDAASIAHEVRIRPSTSTGHSTSG